MEDEETTPHEKEPPMTEELVSTRLLNRVECAAFVENGFITMEPYYWEAEAGQPPHIRAGLMYRVTLGTLDDVIAKLQAVRMDLIHGQPPSGNQFLND
jgi:hypothetical protein